MRRRALCAASAASGNSLFPVTLEKGQYYPEVAQYLMDKYGLNYGTKRNPLPIEETIILGDSFANSTGTGIVKYISTEGTWNASISLKLYLEDHTSGYWCATIDTAVNGGDFGRAGYFMYD